MSGKRAYSRALVFAVFAVFVVFAVHVTAAVASSVAPSFRLPRHSLPNHLEAGSHHFTSIQSAAKSESIFDRFWGTDCFSKALQEFSSECRDLLPAQKARLAFHLVRCQLIVQGEDDEREGRLRCSQSVLLKTCLATLTAREYSLYVELLSSIDVTCLFLQNLSFEASAERVLNDLVTHGVRNSALVSKLGMQLEILVDMTSRQNHNHSTATAAFTEQVNVINAMHDAVVKTAVDIRELFDLIKTDAAEVHRFQQSIRSDVTALIELQETTSRTLQGIASDITWHDASFYAAAVLLLVLASSVGVPAKMRGLYFTWLISVLALERALRLTPPPKSQLRKGVGALVLAAWFVVEWSLRGKRIRAQPMPAVVWDPASPKSAGKGARLGKSVRRSPRLRQSRSFLDPA